MDKVNIKYNTFMMVQMVVPAHPDEPEIEKVAMSSSAGLNSVIDGILIMADNYMEEDRRDGI